MFGKSKLKKYAENQGGLESIVQELIEELKTNGFFIEINKPTNILLKQKAKVGFNVIELALKSETEIKSKALRRGSMVVTKVFSLNHKSQREIASLIINGM